MNPLIRVLLAAMIFAAGLKASAADSGYSFTFTIAQKSAGGTRTEYYGETTRNQKMLYSVTIENKSFKDVGGVEVKYVFFTKQTQLGEVQIGRSTLQRHPGTSSIKTLKHNDKVTFETEGVMLTNTSYAYGYYADERAKGVLRGIWVRLYAGGQMIAEYVEPRDLSSHEQFDDAPPKK